jgi:tetratricopeptide (TPR) repeat protein
VQHLGEMYERRSQYRQAEQQYRRAVSIVERNGLSYRLLAGALDRVAYVCEQQDKTSEAIEFYRRALRTLRGTETAPEITARIEARLAALVSLSATDSARAAAPQNATSGSQGKTAPAIAPSGSQGTR